MDENIVNVSVNMAEVWFFPHFLPIWFQQMMSRITLLNAHVSAALAPLVAMINGFKI